MVEKRRSAFQYRLYWLFLTTLGFACLCARPASVRSKIAVERNICKLLLERGCSFSRNPDPSREVHWMFADWVGEGAGTSVDFVNLGGRIQTAKETQEIVELCKRLPGLRGIAFDLAEPSPELLIELRDLDLQIINLGYVRNTLTDEHCRSLAQLHSLEYVTIRVGKISDSGVQTVRGLPKLRYFVVTALPGTPTACDAGYFDVVFSFDPPPDRVNLDTEAWGGSSSSSDHNGEYYSVL